MNGADVLIAAGIVTAVVSAGYAIAKVVRSFWAAFRHAVREATEDLHEDVRQTKHVVNYHLGPNGATKPMWERLRIVEANLKLHMKNTDDERERNQGDGK